MNDMTSPPETSIGEYYENYKQTQTDLVRIYSKKTRNAILAMATLWLLSDLLGLMMANVFTTQLLLSASVVPALLIVAALLATVQPLVSVIVASLVFVGMWVLTILVFGGIGAMSGLLIKAVIIYFLISGLQNAREATRIKKEVAKLV